MTVSHIKFNRTKFYEPSNTLMCNFTAFVKDDSELNTNGEIDKYKWFEKEEARKNIFLTASHHFSLILILTNNL